MTRDITTSPPAIAFGPQLIGRTEKALNAILDRALVGTGLTEPQWVALTLMVGSDGPVPAGTLTARISDALKVDETTARRRITELTAAGMVRLTASDTIHATEQGTAQWHAVRAATGQVTQQLWGDLSEAELAVAGRVLNTVLARANGVLSVAG